jgi:hypothetical protein
MELFLESEPSVIDRTFGALYADGQFLAHTLEDVVREKAGVPVAEWKIKDVTAIPAGRYRIIITRSPHFSAKAGHDVYLPELLSVPGFEGCASTAATSRKTRKAASSSAISALANKEIFNCAPAVERVKEKIQEAIKREEEIWITVERKQAA